MVNVLADTQAGLAAKYAVPGTPPLEHPIAVGKETEGAGHPLEEAGLVEVRQGTVPVVQGALGAFGCQVVDSIDLSRYASSKDAETKSILYIARVVHVYTEPTASRQPLIYHRQQFVSTSKTPIT